MNPDPATEPGACQEGTSAYAVGLGAWSDTVAVHKLMNRLERDHPQWFHGFDQLDACGSPIDELHRALATAPHAFLGGMVYGMLVLRTRLDGLAPRD